MQIERVGAPRYTGNGPEINISSLDIVIKLYDEDTSIEIDAAIEQLIELKSRIEAENTHGDNGGAHLKDINSRISNKIINVIDRRSFEKPVHYISGEDHYYLYKNSIYKSDGEYRSGDVEYEIRIIERMLPRSMKQAVLCLMEELSFESKVALMSCEREEAVYSNLSLVAKIRNSFGLSGPNKELFDSCRSETYDEASRKIIEALWDMLQESMI